LSNESNTQLSTETAAVLQATLNMIPNLMTDPTDRESVLNEVSPFLLHLIYKAAATYLEIHQRMPMRVTVDQIATLKQALEMLKERWLVAGKKFSASDPCPHSHILHGQIPIFRF
jgi:hypothetical protein